MFNKVEYQRELMKKRREENPQANRDAVMKWKRNNREEYNRRQREQYAKRKLKKKGLEDS